MTKEGAGMTEEGEGKDASEVRFHGTGIKESISDHSEKNYAYISFPLGSGISDI